MELLNNLSDSGRDRLQHEIVERLAGEKEPVDELELAALLGKTLLEKNEELELKLKRLQEFAEETLATSQTLTRQLGETKDSLRFSNCVCEQLELKVEELENSNKHLTKLCDEKQSLIEEKTAESAEIEKDLTQLREEHDKMCADFDKLRKTVAIIIDQRNGETQNIAVAEKEESEEVSQLRETTKELSLKLKDVSFQKRHLERELEEIFSENLNLSRNLEKSEAEVAELHLKFEELSENQETTWTTPASASVHNTFNLSDPQKHSSPDAPLEETNGQSIFSELDSEYNTLQVKYGDLLHKCTCSASLTAYKMQGDESIGSNEQEDSVGFKNKTRNFNKLFEEMFATLRQTAKVADKLLEGSGGK